MALSKYIGEEVLFGFEFNLQDEIAVNGETLSSIVSVTFTPVDANLILNSQGAAAIVGTQIRVWVKGGSSGQTYTGVALAKTSGNKTIEARAPLSMLD